MSHDQLFKTLLRVFFADILALFLPALAARLVPASTTFLDVPQGQRRIADLVARVPLQPSPAPLPNPNLFVPRDAILLHLETDATFYLGVQNSWGARAAFASPDAPKPYCALAIYPRAPGEWVGQ